MITLKFTNPNNMAYSLPNSESVLVKRYLFVEFFGIQGGTLPISLAGLEYRGGIDAWLKYKNCEDSEIVSHA